MMDNEKNELLRDIEQTCCSRLLWQKQNEHSLFSARTGGVFIATPDTNCCDNPLTPLIKFCPFCGEEEYTRKEWNKRHED